MKVKICGLTTAEQVATAIEHGTNFCGFILNYKKSHRYIDYQTAKALTSLDKKNSSYVGVLVDPTQEELKAYALPIFQIYGDYTSEQIKKIKDQ